MQSVDLGQRVVETLNLERDPEFNEELVPKSDVRLAIERFVRALKSLIQSGDGQDAISEDQKDLIKREESISAFLKGMSVQNKSRAIDVSFTSESPVTAWRAANALGDAYLSWRASENGTPLRPANVNRRLLKKTATAKRMAPSIIFNKGETPAEGQRRIYSH
jgi:uncharacterized protein involved in exopolysaccharide biosynthesis